MYESTNQIQLDEINKPEVIYAQLSYKIMGVLFEVQKQLGSGYQEKYYQKAVATELRNTGFVFQEQVPIPLYYKETRIGIYYLDFLIIDGEDKIVLEIKKNCYFSRKHINQVFGYLKASGLKLGILANFTPQGVKYKRIVNLK